MELPVAFTFEIPNLLANSGYLATSTWQKTIFLQESSVVASFAIPGSSLWLWGCQGMHNSNKTNSSGPSWETNWLNFAGVTEADKFLWEDAGWGSKKNSTGVVKRKEWNKQFNKKEKSINKCILKYTKYTYLHFFLETPSYIHMLNKLSFT